MSSSGIPEELYHEILIRLPVKSILKCKCVCKSWCSLISNPDFVESHLQLNKNNSSSNSLLLALPEDAYIEGEIVHSISFDLLESSLSVEEIEHDSAVSMLYPFKFEIPFVTLLGSCNGLVFLRLHDIWDIYYSGCKMVDFLCVWNPATREFKEIPHGPISPYAFLQGDVCIHGLSYDGKNEDYKFVIGAWSDESGLTTIVEVFSVRSNSWETVETLYRFTYDEHKSGVLINEDLHWLANTERGVCMVYLDSSSDLPSFKEIQLPIIPNLEFVSVGVLEDGCLCVVADNGGHVGLGRVEVWEMKVYGVPESWTKRYVISNETITQAVMSKTFEYKNSVRKIIWSFKNGNIVFLGSDDVTLYDPKHGTAIERNLDRFATFYSEVNYVESLVSIHTLKWGTELLEKSTEDEST